MPIKNGRLGLELTDRDKELFRYLFLQKLARIEDIRLDVFGGVSRQAVHRRVLKLVEERYLECTYLPGTEGSLVYFLGKRAFRESIAEKGVLAREQRRSAAPFHDLALLGIRRWLLAQSRVRAFYSENGLAAGIFDDLDGMKALGALNPDAIMKVEFGGKNVLLPLEYEASEKFAARYERTVKRYYTEQKVEAVLVVAKKMQTIEKIMRIESREKAPHRFFYMLWSDLAEQTKFKNLDGVELNLNG